MSGPGVVSDADVVHTNNLAAFLFDQDPVPFLDLAEHLEGSRDDLLAHRRALLDLDHQLTRDSGLINVVDRLPSSQDQWTYWYRGQNSVSQIDYLLLSPALDAATAGIIPRIERRGISFATILADGKPGTMALTGSTDWTNVRVVAGIEPGQDGAVGIVFRCADADNYYRFAIDARSVAKSSDARSSTNRFAPNEFTTKSVIIL